MPSGEEQALSVTAVARMLLWIRTPDTDPRRNVQHLKSPPTEKLCGQSKEQRVENRVTWDMDASSPARSKLQNILPFKLCIHKTAMILLF